MNLLYYADCMDHMDQVVSSALTLWFGGERVVPLAPFTVLMLRLKVMNGADEH